MGANGVRRGGRRGREPDDAAAGRPCGWPGCGARGAYRAPKSRDALRDFHWFCLRHVRLYNAAWSYFDGLDAAAIEAIRRGDASWHRPTWPLGGRGRAYAAADAAGAAFAEARGGGERREEAPPPRPPDPARDKALARLGLDGGASPGEIKARYKTLARRHHPDANGGCKRAEERLKTINAAYGYLRGGAAA